MFKVKLYWKVIIFTMEIKYFNIVLFVGVVRKDFLCKNGFVGCFFILVSFFLYVC